MNCGPEVGPTSGSLEDRNASYLISRVYDRKLQWELFYGSEPSICNIGINSR